MLNKKYFTVYLILLLVYVSFNVPGKTVNNIYSIKQASKSGLIKDESKQDENGFIFSNEGLFHQTIKENDSNNPTFNSYNNNKKYFSTNTVWKSSEFLKYHNLYYCTDRILKINISPLYIKYNRLII